MQEKLENNFFQKKNSFKGLRSIFWSILTSIKNFYNGENKNKNRFRTQDLGSKIQ